MCTWSSEQEEGTILVDMRPLRDSFIFSFRYVGTVGDRIIIAHNREAEDLESGAQDLTIHRQDWQLTGQRGKREVRYLISS